MNDPYKVETYNSRYALQEGLTKAFNAGWRFLSMTHVLQGFGETYTVVYTPVSREPRR